MTFRRRKAAATLPVVVDHGVSSVALHLSDEPWADGPSAEALDTLRRTAAEAVILQDSAEDLLLELRDQRDLGKIAPRCGHLMARFAALERGLPSCVGDPVMTRHLQVLRTILDHHILMLNSARALLAAEWRRSERLTEQLDRIDGLGAPAKRLEAVRREILAHDRA